LQLKNTHRDTTQNADITSNKFNAHSIWTSVISSSQKWNKTVCSKKVGLLPCCLHLPCHPISAAFMWQHTPYW
jgi:hypothetical protein